MEINGKTYKKGDRIETANVTPYEGIWEWNDNNQFFKLKLYKRVVDFAGNKDYTMEVLLGQYQYKINEVEKYNSVNDTTISNLAAGNFQDGKLIFFITDGTTKFRGKGTIELLDGGKLRAALKSTYSSQSSPASLQGYSAYPPLESRPGNPQTSDRY